MPIYIPDSFDSVGDAVVIGGTGGAGRTTFVSLNDTPSSYSGEAGQIVAVNSGETGLEFIAPPTGTSTFTGLTDTPASYAGAGGQFVKVNSGATGLEFVPSPSPTPATGDLLVQRIYRPISGGTNFINVGFRELTTISVPFTATTTAVTVDLQIFIINYKGENVLASLGDDGTVGGYNPVGAVATTLVYSPSASHDLWLNCNVKFYVAGLTPGTSYTWYPALSTTGSGLSQWGYGTGYSPVVVEVKAVA